MTKHLRFLFVMLLAMIWSAGWAQTTIWSEDWSGRKASTKPEDIKYDNVVYSNSNTGTMIYNDKYADGVAPELLLKSKDTWTVTINDLKGCSGSFNLVYKSNNLLKVTANSNAVKLSNSAKLYTGTFEVPVGTKQLVLKFKASSNTRIDDVVLTATPAGETKTATKVSFDSNSGQTFTFTEGEYSDGTFTAPTATETTGVEGTIVYSSDNESAVKVNSSTGALSFPGYGEATITATFTPTDAETYAVSTDSYKVVNKADLGDFVFYESFDKCDGKGGDGTFNGTGSDKVVYENNGWIFTSVNGANKCIKLGSSNKGGSATTPAINLSGKGILTFKIASWEGDGSKVTISVDNGSLSYNGKNATSFAVSPTDKEWNDINMTISATGAVKIKFSSSKSNRFFLDEVMVKDIPTVTLVETATNNTIEAKFGVNVTLKRSMVANEWNTICLPFAVTEDKAKAAFGDNVKIVELDTKAAVDANVLSFKASTGIVAATPYLIKPSAVSETGTYTFDGVDITETNDKYAYSFNNVTNPIAFKGIYNTVDITSDVVGLGDTYYAAFLGADNKIYKAKANGNKTKGFRAYFAIPGSVNAPALRVVIDGTATSIKNIDSEVVESNAPVYNLQGQRVDGNNLTPGIYVKAGKKFVVK